MHILQVSNYEAQGQPSDRTHLPDVSIGVNRTHLPDVSIAMCYISELDNWTRSNNSDESFRRGLNASLQPKGR